MPPKSAPKAAPKPAPTTSSNPILSLWTSYNEQTSDRLRFIDAFLVFLMLTGVVQFVYCVLITNFPFNAFLAGYVEMRYAYLGLISLCRQLRKHCGPVRFDCVSKGPGRPRKQE